MTKTPTEPESSVVIHRGVGVGPVVSGLSREQVEALLPTSETIVSGLGGRMAKIRESQKLTQGELAKRLGRSRATVNQYESGAIEPPLKMVGKLAEVLAVDPALLAFGRTPSSSPPGERLSVLADGDESSDYVELSSGISSRLRITPSRTRLVELTSDAQTFGLRRGDFLFLDTTDTTLHGDGSLYVVRGGAGSLAVVKSDIQLLEHANLVRLTFGQGQLSEVDPRKIEVVGVVRASLRVE